MVKGGQREGKIVKFMQKKFYVWVSNYTGKKL